MVRSTVRFDHVCGVTVATNGKIRYKSNNETYVLLFVDDPTVSLVTEIRSYTATTSISTVQ